MDNPARLQFPIYGKHVGFATVNQPNLTSPDLQNVRPFDTLDNRARGGQRPGLDKWGAGTLVGGENQPVVAMCIVSTVV